MNAPLPSSNPPPPPSRFCSVEHQKMASSRNVRMGSVRHKDVCGLLKMKSGVAKGSVTAEDCQEVCVCACVCVCIHSLTYTLTHTHAHMHTHTHMHKSTRNQLGAKEGRQEMLAFLLRSISIKSTPASTHSTPLCNTESSVPSDRGTCPHPGQRVRVKGLSKSPGYISLHVLSCGLMEGGIKWYWSKTVRC